MKSSQEKYQFQEQEDPELSVFRFRFERIEQKMQ